jgi:hypothetical protein
MPLPPRTKPKSRGKVTGLFAIVLVFLAVSTNPIQSQKNSGLPLLSLMQLRAPQSITIQNLAHFLILKPIKSIPEGLHIDRKKNNPKLNDPEWVEYFWLFAILKF